MSDRTRRTEEYCARAGMEKDSPLRLALMTAVEAAEAAGEAVRGGARGLTPEGEAELIRRVSREVTIAIWREASRIARGIGLATAAMLAVAGYAVGRWDGMRQGAAAVEGAAFLAQVAALNDARALADGCRRTERKEKGGIACDLPPVWIRR